MKKIVTLLLTFIMCISLCACESKAEKELRKAREAANRADEVYKNTVRRNEQLKKDLDELDRLTNSIKNAK